MPDRTSLTIRAFLFAAVLLACGTTAQAQRSRGSETDLLRRDEVQTELGLTDDQKTKLKELQDKSTTSREDFEQYRKDLEAAASDEDKAKVREEFSQRVVKARTMFQDNALSVLNDSQKGALRGLYLKNAGPRGLANSAVAADYGLTAEQTTKLDELSSEQRSASRQLGSESTDEERDKFNAEWEQKYLAVLTTEQKARFEKELAQAPQPSAQPAVAQGGFPGGPGVVPVPGAAAGQAPAMSSHPPAGEQAVLSFGGATAPGERHVVDQFSFNFRYAPWDQVLQMFADGADLTLDLNKVPPGTFSHLDNNTYDAKQALDIMNGYLLRKGFGLFRKDGFLIVLNLDDGIPPSLLRDVEVEELLQVPLTVGANELVNVTFEVQDMDTAKAATEIEPLIGPWGSMIALTESRLLIVTDNGSNLRRIHSLLNTAMSKSKPDAQIFTMYHLKHMDAEEAEIQVMTQFGMRQNVANVSYGVETQSRMQSRSRSQTPQPAPQQQQNTASTDPPIQIASDLRLNSLLVTGTAKQHDLVKNIIEALDVGEAPDGSPLARGRKGTYLEVYQVKSADAGEVTKTLSAMNMPGVTVVNEDRRTGRIHIMASERQHQEVAVLIRQLDGAGTSGSVAVIPLSQMDPLSAAATLRSLFLADGDDAPTIETDLYGRRIIVRGSIEQITQIKQVLADLGEDGSGVRQRGEGGKVRRLSLQGRDPERFLGILKREWEAEEGSRLRIMFSENGGVIESRQTAEGELPMSDDRASQPATQQQPAPSIQPEQTSPGGSDSSQQPPDQNDANKPDDDQTLTSADPLTESAAVRSADHIPVRTNAAPQESNKGQSQESAVDLIVLGDELLLSSPDEEELDRLEDLYDALQQSMPYQQKYTQFFLKSADAIEASDMISQFFPSSSVASTSSLGGSSMMGSLSSSFSSMGSSLMDATGLSGLGMSSTTLKIIPEPRTNSLFMAGPPTLVKDAISLLKVLDSNDGPDSLKDMQPRTIAVNYADVGEVKSMLDDLFKTYLEAQNQGRNQQQNPLAAMFGGGGGRGGNAEAAQVRMHLAVDQQNSLILVNSSQELFDEVEQVVLGLDQAARDANRLIRVIQLKNADASLIQESLRSLLPRVSVSSSRTNSGSGSSAGSGDNNSSRGDNNQQQQQQDAFRRMIEERMRQQSGGGGTGRGGTTGGRPSFGGRTGGGFPGFGGRGGR